MFDVMCLKYLDFLLKTVNLLLFMITVNKNIFFLERFNNIPIKLKQYSWFCILLIFILL